MSLITYKTEALSEIVFEVAQGAEKAVLMYHHGAQFTFYYYYDGELMFSKDMDCKNVIVLLRGAKVAKEAISQTRDWLAFHKLNN